MIKGVIFDLDGVLVDSATHHYQSWNKLAESLGFTITLEQNENLKGVSRMQSLEYILKLGGLTATDEQKQAYAAKKNDWYVDLISNLSEDDLLPGSKELLMQLQDAKIKISLGSASKNAVPVLESTGIMPYFDYISDGNSTQKSKPDPEVFLIAAKGLELLPQQCLVFEDSQNGVKAAVNAGFMSIGIGEQDILGAADHVRSGLDQFSWSILQELYQN